MLYIVRHHRFYLFWCVCYVCHRHREEAHVGTPSGQQRGRLQGGLPNWMKRGWRLLCVAMGSSWKPLICTGGDICLPPVSSEGAHASQGKILCYGCGLQILAILGESCSSPSCPSGAHRDETLPQHNARSSPCYKVWGMYNIFASYVHL